MMASITPCCASVSRAGVLLARWLLPWLALAACIIGSAHAAQSGGIDIRKAALTASEDGYLLEAEIDIQLSPQIEDVLNKGVPLYFMLEFEVTRSRWYWTNEKIASVQQPWRLSYNTLTRQYRVGAGALYQNFSTLAEALAFMTRVRRRGDIPPGALQKDTTYAAALRMRLDVTQLPKPFQLNTGRDWNVGSDWFRWAVTP
jgi:Domain of unknown function (DUF4390)